MDQPQSTETITAAPREHPRRYIVPTNYVGVWRDLLLSVGDAVEVVIFGRFVPGTVVGLGFDAITVDYESPTKRGPNRREFHPVRVHAVVAA